MTNNNKRTDRKYSELYFLNVPTGTAHTRLSCAMARYDKMEQANIDKVGKEDIDVESDRFCGTCCYKGNWKTDDEHVRGK